MIEAGSRQLCTAAVLTATKMLEEFRHCATPMRAALRLAAYGIKIVDTSPCTGRSCELTVVKMDCQPAVANPNANNIRSFAGIIVIKYDWEFIHCGSSEKPIQDAPLDRVWSLLDTLRFFR